MLGRGGTAGEIGGAGAIGSSETMGGATGGGEVAVRLGNDDLPDSDNKHSLVQSGAGASGQPRIALF